MNRIIIGWMKIGCVLILIGQLIVQKTMLNKATSIDFVNLKQQIYFLKIQDIATKEFFVKKILKFN